MSDYRESLSHYLERLDGRLLAEIAHVINDVRLRAGTVFIAGNGGSAATAAHWANDLAKATGCVGRPGIRAIALSENMSLLTALANDHGFESVFGDMLAVYASPGDAYVVLSVSGASANVVQGARVAKAMGLETIGFLGVEGSVAGELMDRCIVLGSPAGVFGPVESVHAIACDILTEILRR